MERGERAERAHLLERAQRARQELAHVHRVVQERRSAELRVDPRQRQRAVEVVLEAALAPEVLEDLARAVEIARELRDPGASQHRELVEVAVAGVVLAREELASDTRLLRQSAGEELEHPLELE